MKIRILLTFATAIFLAGTIAGQEIDEKILKEIKTYYRDDAATRAITNAITNNDISKLVINRENAGKIDPYFSYKVKTKGITDQKSTGRCWLFTGLNVIRSGVIEKYNMKEFFFSQNYSFFWDQLEKANLFLEGIIKTVDKSMDDRTVEWLFKNAIGDGGVWTGFVLVVQKYGVVPQEAMPETNSSENTRWMTTMIRQKLKEDGLLLRDMYARDKSIDDLRKEKTHMLGEIYHILAINLGEPPEKFTWRYEDKDGKISELKTYTPKEFYVEFVGVDMNDYVLFMDDPTREYYRLYEIEYDRNLVEGKNWRYINLLADELKNYAIASIKDNEAMYFSCDVGKQLDREKGYLDVHNQDFESLMGVKFGMDKKERIMTFESGSTHGMSLCGVDLDKDGKPVKWLLENSWGSKSGQEGYLFMTDEWFDEYLFRLVIMKKYIPEEVLDILKQEPVMLPPWDPMFAPEE